MNTTYAKEMKLKLKHKKWFKGKKYSTNPYGNNSREKFFFSFEFHKLAKQWKNWDYAPEIVTNYKLYAVDKVLTFAF